MAIFIDLIIIVSLLTAMVAMLWAASNFEKIIDLEYGKYRAQWKRDGKPRIAASQIPGSNYDSWKKRWFSARFATQRLRFGLLFSTPIWMKRNAKANLLLQRYRIGSFVEYGIIVLWWTIGILNSLHV